MAHEGPQRGVPRMRRRRPVQSARARWIHAATHGFFDLEHLRIALAPDPARRGIAALQIVAMAEPSPSAGGAAPPRVRPGGGWNPLLLFGLVLAGANANDGGAGEDGWSTAEELQAIDLTGVELVVLSACETGRGESASGEGSCSWPGLSIGKCTARWWWTRVRTGSP